MLPVILSAVVGLASLLGAKKAGVVAIAKLNESRFGYKPEEGSFTTRACKKDGGVLISPGSNSELGKLLHKMATSLPELRPYRGTLLKITESEGQELLAMVSAVTENPALSSEVKRLILETPNAEAQQFMFGAVDALNASRRALKTHLDAIPRSRVKEGKS